MDYGRVNSIGKPSKQEAVSVVRYAIEHGVNAIDTAHAYGDAETLVGETIKDFPSRVTVITKLDMCGLKEDASRSEVRSQVDVSVYASCRALRTETLDILLLHAWSHHDMWRGAAWERLLEHVAEGRITVVGASVYHPQEALAALADKTIKHLQIPTNILDRRWKAFISQRRMYRPDIVVHARSPFLQGILLHSAECWPTVPGFNNRDVSATLTILSKEFQRTDIADLCLAYVRSLAGIDGVVVGNETLDQLKANLALFSRSGMSNAELEQLESTIPNCPELLLNPTKWNSKIEVGGAHAS
jgi:aryl-alcohol dehydrogenase-like predicted oxidoreductase